MKDIRIGKHSIGSGNPTYVIAEAGGNHNGSLETAKKLIEVAAEAEADAVKFQVFRAHRVYPRSAGMSDYLQMSRSIYEVIAELEMPWEWLPQLAEHCEKASITFLASVFDDESADRLDPYVAAFKIASYEMTHWPLIRHTAAKKKPLIVSTGAAELSEVREMVQEVRNCGSADIALMQCTASYPAPLTSLNILAIETMKREFGVPVGLSDHSRDPIVGPMAAVALGADLIEKHFTLSNRLPGPDHAFAVEPEELKLMVRRIREVQSVRGNPAKVVDPVESDLRHFARRSIFTTRQVTAGEKLTPENVAVLRCGKLVAGLAPRDFERVLGKRAVRDIPAEQPLTDADLA
ncbi:MAG: N-acetylneuraminate synthase family protein [Thermoanaerobaculia bacterium]